MSVYDRTFDIVIEKALNILFDKKADIFTFALYYDHEGWAVEVCADTVYNSQRTVRASNAFNREQFFAAIERNDLETATVWNCNTGRSLSLGDFQYKMLGWEPIKAPNNSVPFFRAMVRALIRNSHKIAALTRNPEQLVLCCSTKNSEVGLIWFHEEAA
jgi:hypothetical protein